MRLQTQLACQPATQAPKQLRGPALLGLQRGPCGGRHDHGRQQGLRQNPLARPDCSKMSQLGAPTPKTPEA